jgi:hypothetical protein
MSFNFSRSIILEDEGLLRALQHSMNIYWKFLSMNRKLGSTLSEGKRKRKLINYIQLAIVARENKTNPFIVFDKKLVNMPEAHVL